MQEVSNGDISVILKLGELERHVLWQAAVAEEWRLQEAAAAVQKAAAGAGVGGAGLSWAAACMGDIVLASEKQPHLEVTSIVKAGGRALCASRSSCQQRPRCPQRFTPSGRTRRPCRCAEAAGTAAAGAPGGATGAGGDQEMGEAPAQPAAPAPAAGGAPGEGEPAQQGTERCVSCSARVGWCWVILAGSLPSRRTSSSCRKRNVQGWVLALPGCRLSAAQLPLSAPRQSGLCTPHPRSTAAAVLLSRSTAGELSATSGSGRGGSGSGSGSKRKSPAELCYEILLHFAATARAFYQSVAKAIHVPAGEQ